jgi:mevalonate kinase
MSEIERLRELVDAGKEDRKAIDELVDENDELVDENDELVDQNDELVDENLRLRELLEKALVYSHSMPTTLVAAIEKEVGDDEPTTRR